MLFFGIKNFWFRIGILSILGGWTLWMIVAMYRSFYIFDPYDPTLTGTASYGHNHEGAFTRFLTLMLIELGIGLAVLLPWSFSRFYWLRCLILLVIFFSWMLLMAVAGMHGGNVDMLHTLWLFGINIIILVLLVVSIIAEVLNRRKDQPMSHA